MKNSKFFLKNWGKMITDKFFFKNLLEWGNDKGGNWQEGNMVVTFLIFYAMQNLYKK